MREQVSVIDLFAGPGGLAEGFGSYVPDGHRKPAFHIAVSVEKDEWAHRTLLLRAFFRQFARTDVPENYYSYLRGEINREELFERHPFEAERANAEALRAELGSGDDPHVYANIKSALEKNKGNHWVLIGGPPCQAYSVIGRSRMRALPGFKDDPRHLLYKEYLSILDRFQPSVFVMENVKGMLSAKVDGELIFKRIMADLARPSVALHGNDEGHRIAESTDKAICYKIYSLVVATRTPSQLKPTDFIIRSEEYGIPQMRHRVILLGVREDVLAVPSVLERVKDTVALGEVLEGLPKLRSHLSKNPLNAATDMTGRSWKSAIESVLEKPWLKELALDSQFDERLSGSIATAARSVDEHLSTGAEFLQGGVPPAKLADWFQDARLGGICNHTSRGHLTEDLHRYLFCACYAQIYELSPLMGEFPTSLLPHHRNIQSSRKAGTQDEFDDRFRVQVIDRPATTITAHISKDGHYNIHYDPLQCRSLTVREAARLQTFPDNYFFEGARTQQYLQVGNAVPPLLATMIAKVVDDLIKQAEPTSTP